MIKKVTITGADDSIDPLYLIGLTKKYPFVEWAILVSRSSTGSARFPSMEWITYLLSAGYKFPLSLHLCGAYVREILVGDFNVVTDLTEIWKYFDRVQINTHGIKHDFRQSRMLDLMSNFPDKEYIFQYDNKNTDALLAASHAGISCSALFDMSHGAGVLPSDWPELLPSIKCGYAGGISPDNIEEQIIKVNNKVKDTETWIDMETHVRSNGDVLFDLDKVEKCLSIADKYIKI